MGKHVVFALLLVLGFPAIVLAACTEEELNFKKEKALLFRMHALQGQGKLTEYMQLGSEVGRDFSTFYTEYQRDKPKGQPYLDRMCAIIDRVIVLADDLLAGGDGLGKRTLWMSHRPEEMLKAAETFRAYCKTPEVCDTREGREITENLELLPKVLAGGAEPARLVDENYERIQHFLAKEKE
jgi:hypothetical protein